MRLKKYSAYFTRSSVICSISCTVHVSYIFTWMHPAVYGIRPNDTYWTLSTLYIWNFFYSYSLSLSPFSTFCRRNERKKNPFRSHVCSNMYCGGSSAPMKNCAAMKLWKLFFSLASICDGFVVVGVVFFFASFNRYNEECSCCALSIHNAVHQLRKCAMEL